MRTLQISARHEWAIPRVVCCPPGTPNGDAPSILNSSYKPVFVWNLIDLKCVRWEGSDIVPSGKHTLEFDFKYEGLGMETLAFGSSSGIGRGGTGVLNVDGKAVATQNMEHTIPFLLQWDENFDIGADTGTTS